MLIRVSYSLSSHGICRMHTRGLIFLVDYANFNPHVTRNMCSFVSSIVLKVRIRGRILFQEGEDDTSTIVIVDQYVKNSCSGDWPTNGTSFGVLAH